jgi:hypothetical protein
MDKIEDGPLELTPEARAALERADALAAHREARAKRAEEERDKADALELEAFELEAKLEAKLGKSGEEFAIVNNRFGVFAVRKPDTRAIRNWERATDKEKLSIEWMLGLLRHYIEPTEKAIPWAQLGAQRPGLVWQTGEAFVELMGIDRSKLEKKG